MRIPNLLFASAAALGLVTAPIAAQAAPVRSATPVAHGNKLAGGTPVVLYVALAAFAVALAIVLANSDNGHVPTSP